MRPENAIRRAWRWATRFVFALFACAVMYASAGLIGALIPVNAEFRETEDGIPIYIVSNGIHVDVVVPVRSAVGDWSRFLPMADFGDFGARSNYLAFGWGDRAVFLDVPEWSDLSPVIALKALVGANGTVMHVEPYLIEYGGDPAPGRSLKLRVSPQQLQKLSRYLEAGFFREGERPLVRVGTASYWGFDAFYPARGRYSPFLTCNEWIRRGLAEAEIRVPVWSPLAMAIFYQAEKSILRPAAGAGD